VHFRGTAVPTTVQSTGSVTISKAPGTAPLTLAKNQSVTTAWTIGNQVTSSTPVLNQPYFFTPSIPITGAGGSVTSANVLVVGGILAVLGVTLYENVEDVNIGTPIVNTGAPNSQVIPDLKLFPAF